MSGLAWFIICRRTFINSHTSHLTMAAMGMVMASCGNCRNAMQGPPGMVVACPTCGTQLMMPMGAPSAAGGMMMMPTMGAPMAANPYEELERNPTLLLKQKVDMLEVFTGFEIANRYGAFRMDATGNREMNPLFYFFEESECCERQFCKAARSFNMKCLTPTNINFATFRRPFRCTLLCCNRPEMDVIGGDGASLGSVYSQFSCCSDVMDIKNGSGVPEFQIYGACCQLGNYCFGPCPPCNEIIFDIMPAGGVGAPLGSIKKVWGGFLREAFTEADTFLITFPPTATGVQRLNIIASVILIDFIYFESKRQHNNNNAVDMALN